MDNRKPRTRMDDATFAQYLKDVGVAGELTEKVATLFGGGLTLDVIAADPNGAALLEQFIGNMATRNFSIVAAINFGKCVVEGTPYDYISVAGIFFMDSGEDQVFAVLVEAARRAGFKSGDKLDWTSFENAVKAGITPAEWEAVNALYPAFVKSEQEDNSPVEGETPVQWFARLQAGKASKAAARMEEPKLRLRRMVRNVKPTDTPAPASVSTGTSRVSALLAKIKGGSPAPVVVTSPVAVTPAPAGNNMVADLLAKRGTPTPIVQPVDPKQSLLARLGKPPAIVTDEKGALIAHFRSLNGDHAANATMIADGLEGKTGAAPLSVEEAKQFASTLGVTLPS